MSYSPMIDDFFPELSQLVTVAPYLGMSGANVRTYGPAKTYHCRIQEDAKAIYTVTGQQVVSTGTIFVHPRATDTTVLTALTADAKVTLPDGTSPRLLRVGAEPDGNGLTVYWRLMT